MLILFISQINFQKRRVGGVKIGPDDTNITFPLALELDMRITLLGTVLLMLTYNTL